MPADTLPWSESVAILLTRQAEEAKQDEGESLYGGVVGTMEL